MIAGDGDRSKLLGPRPYSDMEKPPGCLNTGALNGEHLGLGGSGVRRRLSRTMRRSGLRSTAKARTQLSISRTIGG